MKRQGIKFMSLFSLAYMFLKNMAAMQLYRLFNIDFTHPIRVNAQLNNECNSKCNMCDVWRQDKKELPATVWINSLKQLKSSLGDFTVGFAGGEVLLKKDVFELFEFCHNADIPYTITTNGKLLTAKNISRLLQLKPLNINISIDSLEKDVYLNIRGVSFLESVKSNIDYLMMYIEENSLNTKVFFKTVVNNLNLDELPKLANYAFEKKVAGITFDPIRRRRRIYVEEKIEEFEKMATIDMNKLSASIRKLVELKNEGVNILNSEVRMNQWFEPQDNNRKFFCNAPLRDVYINSEGHIRLCDYTESYIGNIANDDIGLILKSKTSRIEKKKLTKCDNPCDYCIHRNLLDYSKIFFSYVKS